MAYQKLQVSDGLEIVQSDTIPIPNPSSEVISGTTVGTAVANKLVDTGATFENDGIIVPKAIVYNTTDMTAAYVTAIDSDTTLSLSADIFTAGEDYVIYNEATTGCILYVGGAGNVSAVLSTDKDVPPASQKQLTFKNLPNASFLPTQVVRVDATDTTATDIIALW